MPLREWFFASSYLKEIQSSQISEVLELEITPDQALQFDQAAQIITRNSTVSLSDKAKTLKIRSLVRMRAMNQYF